MKFFLLLLALTNFALAQGPVVTMETSLGIIEIELDQAKAKLSVDNFMSYVDKKFYDGTIFHRVINGFMIQGGGFTEGMKEKPTGKPVKNESDNGLKNLKGTIAMARTSDLHSATSQFYINVADNDSLNAQGPGPNGYAVFGKVISGMHVVERIKELKTGTVSGHADVPMDTVLIKSVKRKSKK
ncbi:MAG TPA: peptidylprolyl isomerase [Bacteriovoracaceae bacterium]|nr:peptidylprolyl isomerase [Bacteriovoracaceae bacterium]